MRRRKDSVSKSRLFGTDCPILHESLPHTLFNLEDMFKSFRMNYSFFFNLYFCLLLLGLSGIVISTSPSLIEGSKIIFSKSISVF